MRIQTLLTIVSPIILVHAAVAVGQGAPVEQTGQSTCYNTDGNPIPCAGTGQDGEGRHGVPWPSPRFSDEGDGTVTDNLTGLTWLRNASCAGLPGTLPDGKGEWITARDAAAALAHGACGLTDGSSPGDWRLPTIAELASLIHYGVDNPTLPNAAGTGRWTNGDPFLGVESSEYWSCTYHYQGWDVWVVDLMNGQVEQHDLIAQLFIWPVRGAWSDVFSDGFESGDTGAWDGVAGDRSVLVVRTLPAPVERTGQTSCYDGVGGTSSCAGTGQDGEHQHGVPWPNPRFVDHGDGTVTDTLTGLVWLQDPLCYFITDFWQDSIDWAAALHDGCTTCGGVNGDCGLSDGSNAGTWRLPNLKELASLVNYEFSNPCLPDTAGTGQMSPGDPFSAIYTGTYAYWTSTTVPGDGSQAAKVSFSHCQSGYPSPKVNGLGGIWPVKGGN